MPDNRDRLHQNACCDACDWHPLSCPCSHCRRLRSGAAPQETSRNRLPETPAFGLYHHLWVKNDRGFSAPLAMMAGTSTSTTRVRVPDTVVFVRGQPLAWYFESKQQPGQILKKNRKHLTLHNIFASFAANPHGVNGKAGGKWGNQDAIDISSRRRAAKAVVATLVVPAARSVSPDANGGDTCGTELFYLDADGLSRFLSRERARARELAREEAKWADEDYRLHHEHDACTTPGECKVEQAREAGERKAKEEARQNNPPPISP